MLFCILNGLVLHLALIDLELDLALILQLGQHHEGLVVITIVDKTANFTDLLVGLKSLVNLVDAQGAANLLLTAISHLLQTLEVNHCWLHLVGGLLLLVHLESH